MSFGVTSHIATWLLYTADPGVISTQRTKNICKLSQNVIMKSQWDPLPGAFEYNSSLLQHPYHLLKQVLWQSRRNVLKLGEAVEGAVLLKET